MRWLTFQIVLQLQCCGTTGPEFWGSALVRPSCCGGQSGCSTITANRDGCKQKIEDFLIKNGKIVGGVAIGVALVEVRVEKLWELWWRPRRRRPGLTLLVAFFSSSECGSHWVSPAPSRRPSGHHRGTESGSLFRQLDFFQDDQNKSFVLNPRTLGCLSFKLLFSFLTLT